VVREIAVNTGRTGKVTPFAVLDPVFVGGVTVTNATLHNQDEVQRKDVREGDTVIVRRAGDVIPEIVGPVLAMRPPDSAAWEFPRVCPSCATPLERPEGEADWRCPNRAHCPSQAVEWIFYFAQPAAMDIDHLGYKTVAALLERGLVRDPADVFFLTAAALGTLPGFKDKSVQNLLDAIAAAKDRPFKRLLVGLNIRHVGVQGAEQLALAFQTMDALGAATLEELQTIDGVGPEIAASVHAWCREPDNQALLAKLGRAGVRMADESDDNDKTPAQPRPLAGKTVVITGTLTSLSREAASQAAKQAGARVASSVSKQTAFLVAGGDPGSKRDKAQALGVEIIDEAEFLKRLQGLV
jgi:DNA ligase (NAD+)